MGRSYPRNRRTAGQGSVYFDKAKNRWIGEAWIDGRRRRVSAGSKLDCSAKLGKLIHAGEADRHLDRQLTVGRLLDEWITRALAARELAPSTVDRHLWAARLCADKLGKVKLENLTPQQVERALDQLAHAGLSRASVTKVRSTLSQVLAWAVNRRAVAFNAAAVAELPSAAAPPSPRRALTAEELQLLLKTAEGHPLGPMFMLCGRIGLRPGEAMAVMVDAIDLEGAPPTLTVRRGVQRDRGRPTVSETLKTTTAFRTVALPADVADSLRRHLESIGIDKGLLFAGADGGPLWSTTVRVKLHEMCDEAGVPRITANELRHTAATVMVESGLAPHEVADILGHTTSRMVDVTYRHRPRVIRGADRVDL